MHVSRAGFKGFQGKAFPFFFPLHNVQICILFFAPLRQEPVDSSALCGYERDFRNRNTSVE
jgi:hypothetical protein